MSELVLVDNDTVSASNINRQVLFSVRDVGRRKVEAAKENLDSQNIHTGIHVIMWLLFGGGGVLCGSFMYLHLETYLCMCVYCCSCECGGLRCCPGVEENCWAGQKINCMINIFFHIILSWSGWGREGGKLSKSTQYIKCSLSPPVFQCVYIIRGSLGTGLYIYINIMVYNFRAAAAYSWPLCLYPLL